MMTWALRARIGPGPNNKKIVVTRKGCLADEINIVLEECEVTMVVKLGLA